MTGTLEKKDPKSAATPQSKGENDSQPIIIPRTGKNNTNQSVSLETIVYKRSGVKVAVVDKDRLDSIKETVEAAEKSNKKWDLSDIFLGISTTCLGAFLGNVSSFFNMIATNTYTASILWDCCCIIGTFVFFLIFLFSQKSKHTTLKGFIDKIKEQIDSIYKHMEDPNEVQTEITLEMSLQNNNDAESELVNQIGSGTSISASNKK